jgi:NAD(P)-dependent dehydrogenase (short-subunit alcohol dehydrogenase family)
MGRLSGKTALVTGGTRGIGLGIVRHFLKEGARVAFTGTSEVGTSAALGELGRPDGAFRIVADLSDAAAPKAVVDAAVAALGGIDIVVNNAGIGSRSSVWELTPEEWDRVHDVNLRATFFVSRDAALSMRDRGGGAIINVSSIAGQNGGLAGSPAYASSKAAVIGLTRALARRLAPVGVRVNCLSPADIETDMTAGWPQDLRDQLNAITPLGRFGSIEEVTGAAVFLASDEASYITGQTLAINGGAYLG